MTPVSAFFGQHWADFDRAIDELAAAGELEPPMSTGVPVPLAILVPTQAHVDERHVRAILARPARELADRLSVTKLRGRYFLTDGHHAAVALKRMGVVVALAGEFFDWDRP